MTSQAVFTAAHLTCFRQNRRLFSDISFDLFPQQVLIVEGANGAGKSSLLRILSGLSTPCSGSIYWQGQSIETAPDLFHQALHYIGHSNGIKLGLSVIENLTLTQHHLLIKKAPAYDDILNALQLSHHRNTITNRLSAGQKRRLAIARLLLFPKPLWIVDEPLTALDHDMQHFFLTCLEAHSQQGGMAIVTSHQPINLNHLTVSSLRLGA